jgi:2-oxoisovalerate dehydrogenase E2 component (dihydrolipoyl transacylase)
MPDFLLPDLGEGLEEAEVIAWRVAAGDRVAVDQVIAEVETAKAVVEVPVPYAGIVATLHATPGTTISVGDPLITITADEPTATDAQASGEEASGSVLIGYGTTVAPARSRRAHRRPPASGRPRRVAVISPLVRKEAKDAGLDLTSITGTGPEGVVSRQDVRQAIAARAEGGERAGLVRENDFAGERRIPLRGARRAAADKMARSRREIPEATVWVDLDATSLVSTRRALNAADPARPVSLLALLARFTILGLRRYPELNARIEGDEIILPGRVNLGFAAQTEHGLVVPVVPDADRLSTRELSARLAERTVAARERRLAPADLAGGTFTVNNYGVFGVDGSAAIINHPEVAILGMGRVMDRPWVVDGQLTVRKVTELTLSFDHRACDGGTAGGFLRYVADCLESPSVALGDM